MLLPEADSGAGELVLGDCVCVIKGVRASFWNVPELTDSGSSKLSMFSAAKGSDPAAAFGLFALLGDGSFMREAGVAGDGFPAGRGARLGPSVGVELF